MKRRQIVIVVIAGVVLGLLVAAELVLPSMVENEVESRLTEGGGSAEVSLSAFPAERLFWRDGDSVEISGEDLDLVLIQDDPEVFATLDGFDRVDVKIADSFAGPFEIDDFQLTRDGDGPYRLISSSTTSLAELAEFGAESFGIPGSDLLGGILGLADGTGTSVPVELDMVLESEDGRVEVVSGEGTVAGIPTGPLAELIVGAVVSRL